MEAIASGDADYAVLPIENSSAGIVSENYDLMVEYGHCIVGEQIIKIEHALLGVPGAKLSDITDVYSHPQALMQCARDVYKRQLREHRAGKCRGIAQIHSEIMGGVPCGIDFLISTTWFGVPLIKSERYFY